MPSYEHDKLLDRIADLDTVPEDAADYADWIEAGGHLDLLRDNGREDEVIIYASSYYTFIHAVVVNENSLSPLNQDDLLEWSGNPYSVAAGYAWGAGSNDVWIEGANGDWGTKTLESARQLVFARQFEGLSGDSGFSCEILQEYAHVAGIHWRPEQRAYCSLDTHGDMEHVVSITPTARGGGGALVSFRREQLEQYLAASNSLLVRMFDFTLFRPEEFTRWPVKPESVIRESNDFFYRQKVDTAKAAYARGVQIIRPARPKSVIFSSTKEGSIGRRGHQHVEFVAYDHRNSRIASISTDPTATTSYFDAAENSLPFAVTPAFFRPDVLHKYKADREKYTVDEERRSIRCRGAWDLRTYDINEAGQVHTYICYLGELPYHEQLYWKSFNEEPKAGISERAFLNDFKGEPSDITNPLQDILAVLRRWAGAGVAWWSLRDEGLLEGVNTPRTSSRDEWARAFQDLAALVIEGFEIKAVRQRLRGAGIEFDKGEKSLALIERVLAGHHALVNGQQLTGLRTVQRIRSKVASHSRGSDAAKLADSALTEYGTYPEHFESICRTVAYELDVVEKALSGALQPATSSSPT